MLLYLLLAACGGEATITWSTEPCTDWVVDGSEDPVVTVNSDGAEGLVIQREGVMRPLDDSFAPDVVGEGKVLRIFEGWEGGTVEDEVCTAPTVYVQGLPPRTYTIQWFTEDSDVVPEQSLEIEL